MKYKCICICADVKDTEKELNRLAKLGWKVICSYAFMNNYLILEKKDGNN